MSVLLELTMFPTDKGESVSGQVSRIIEMIDRRGIDYRLTSMGTIMEFATIGEALAVISDAYALLESDCNRVFGTATFDIRKGRENRLSGKVESIERHLGKKAKS
jgi:uncharacterized protein (TIGR00106 family)